MDRSILEELQWVLSTLANSIVLINFVAARTKTLLAGSENYIELQTIVTVFRLQEANETLAGYINGMHELLLKCSLSCSELEKVSYSTEGLKPSLKVKVLKGMPETLCVAKELARTFNLISRLLEDKEPESLLLGKLLAPKQAPSSHVFLQIHLFGLKHSSVNYQNPLFQLQQQLLP